MPDKGNGMPQKPWLAVVFRLLLAGFVPTGFCQAGPPPRVLVLFSNDRLLPANQEMEKGLRNAFESGGKTSSVDLFAEFLDAVRFPSPEQSATMEEFLRGRHRDTPPVAWIAIGTQALDFLMQRRDSFFPGTPIVFGGIDTRQVESLTDRRGLAGRPMDWSIAPLLEQLPETRLQVRRILLVSGAAGFDRVRHEQALAQAAPYEGRYQIETSLGEPLEDLLDRVSKLPEDSLVIYLSYFQTPDGRTLLPQSVAGWLAEKSPVPVLCYYETYVGTGVMGGAMIPFEEEGRAIGTIARRVLEGAAAESIGILPAGKPRWIVDERAMRRHGWNRRSLPPSAEIRFRKPSLWEAHRPAVVTGAAALLLQSALIIGLLAARARQRRAENERHLSESRFSRVFTASPVSISIIRQSDGRIVDANPAWERTTGVARGEALGRTHLELGFGFEGSGDQRYLEYLASGKALRDFEQRLRMPNGKRRLLSVSTELVNLHGEACFISMAKDITDTQEAEEAREKLQRASRLGMLGELTASIAHEVNQPLGAILSNADAASMLIDLPAPPLDEIREILSDIRRDDMRASEVIRQVRSMIADGETHMVPLHPGELAQGVVAMVRHDCRRRSISLHCDIAENLPQVCAEKVRIEQVLLNLLLNAMDSLQDVGPDNRHIRMAVALADDGMVDISVSDSGPGIPPDLMERIFENFFSTKSEGMGLGLALSRSIAEAHNGKLLARNAPEGGACFHLILPPIP
ncbi:MAG: ATP-binding protein [Akkermansiaceae bacterium]|nr:ATP-binding protein [Akkermansiaceae bacterium]